MLDDICTVIFQHLDEVSKLNMSCVSRQWQRVCLMRHGVQRARLSLRLSSPIVIRTCSVAECTDPPLRDVTVQPMDNGRVYDYTFIPYCRHHFHAFVDNLSYGDVMTSQSNGCGICVVCLR